ncbi:MULTISPECIES: hypothetical protein [Yoonia]|jgi:hypothetical protein|nr:MULTISPECIES: hypothetical protein [Yoonia]
MAKEITTILIRSRHTLIGDALGIVALMVLLFVGLALPGPV